ncbi:hypothetical protein J6590_103719 [Homalodisca vitripennis]|nr:hypothetical protein J6590_103719 [Homalodisca vitripennis]
MDIGVKPFTVASEGVPMLGWPLLPELGECHLHHYVGKKSSSIRYVHDGHRKELNIHSGRRNLLGNIEAY